MKEIINEKDKQREIKYPCLMERTLKEGLQVIYFTNESCGVLLFSEHSSQPKGMILHNWVMDSFEPFNGSITLSND